MCVRWRLARCLAVVTVALSAAAMGSSSAATIAKRAPWTTLVPGTPATLQASVTTHRWCRLVLFHPGAPSSESAPRRATSGLAEYRWGVPKDVAPGAWEGTVDCGLTRGGLLRGAVTEARSVLLRVARQGRQFHGRAANGISVVFPRSERTPVTAGRGKGGGAYPAYGSLLIPGGAWLDGRGVNVYSDGADGGDGYYQCVELINRLITTLGWSPSIWGNANQLYADASPAYFTKYPNGSGYKPVLGDIIVWGGGYGNYGHVAVVEADSGSLLTVVEQNASPSGYDTYQISASGYVGSRYGYYVEGYLHAKANQLGVTQPPPTATVTTGTTPEAYAETTGGVTNTWSDYADASGTQGPTISGNQTVQVACRTSGFTVADGNSWWYLIASSPWSGSYYASADAFYNNGQTSGSLQGTPFYDPAVPTCNGSKSSPATTPTTSATTTPTSFPTSTGTTTSSTSSPTTSSSTTSSSTAVSISTPTTSQAPPQTPATPGPPPAPTYSETVGGNANTWSNYSDAGGAQGPTVPAYETVQVTCAVQGFRVSDGNTWWYRIASSPWDNAYYVSADAFYNDGRTSGSLIGTPFVDPSVPQC